MKRLLLASTALITTAVVASADVILDPEKIPETTFLKLSGDGRFGIGYLEDRNRTLGWTVPGPDNVFGTPDDIITTNSVESDDTILISRFRLNIDVSAETDGGAKFTSRVRIQAEENAATGEANVAEANGANFSVTYGGLHVAAGNVGGAIDSLPNYYGHEVGLEAFAGHYSAVDYSILGYSSGGTGANAVIFKYEVGNVAVLASYDQQTRVTRVVSPGRNADGSIIGNVSKTDGDRWDIGVSYTFGNITAGVGHGQTDLGTSGDDPSLTVLTLGGTFGDLKAALFVADDKTENAATDGSAYGVSAAYTVGAATLQIAYGDGGADDDTQWIGVGAHYDLGGGASLRGGIGRSDQDSREDRMRADFGAHFAF